MRKRLFLFSVLVLFLSPIVSANSGTVHLSPAYIYQSTHFSTFIKWSNDIYGDVLNYGLGSDSHINFTDFSIAASSNPSWTFGVVSQNGNATLTSVASSFIRFTGSTQASKTLNLTFYYRVTAPQTVYVFDTVNNTITQTQYYSSYSAWLSAPSPAVFWNTGSGFLMVKTPNAAPTIQFDSSFPPVNTGNPVSYLWLLLIPFALVLFLLARKRL